jgi:hypothetical protein
MHVVARIPASAAAAGPSSGSAREPRLPHGFIPVEDVRALPMMGRWNALPDGMPPWLPFHALLEVSRHKRHWPA